LQLGLSNKNNKNEVIKLTDIYLTGKNDNYNVMLQAKFVI